MRYRLSFIFGCVVPLFFKAKDKSICERKKRKKITPVLQADHRAPTGFATVILLSTWIRRAKEMWVVYNLHGETGRLTVWANVKQNSGLINFPPESRLPFVQISSIYRITAAKVWDGFEEMEHEFSLTLEHSVRKKTRLPFQMFRCSRKSSAGTTQKVVFHLLSNRIFRRLIVNGLQAWRARYTMRARGGHTCEKKGRRGRPALIGALNRFLVPQNSHFIEAIQLEMALAVGSGFFLGGGGGGAGTVPKHTTKILSWLSLCKRFWHRMLYFTQYKNSP